MDRVNTAAAIAPAVMAMSATLRMPVRSGPTRKTQVHDASAVHNPVDQVADASADEQGDADQERDADRVGADQQGDAHSENQDGRSDAKRDACTLGQARAEAQERARVFGIGEGDHPVEQRSGGSVDQRGLGDGLGHAVTADAGDEDQADEEEARCAARAACPLPHVSAPRSRRTLRREQGRRPRRGEKRRTGWMAAGGRGWLRYA
jgi:hypothetical protein